MNKQLLEIQNLLKKQYQQAKNTINLMPIENYLSNTALHALSTDGVNRYCLGNTRYRMATGWYTPGEKTLISLEKKTNNILKLLFNAKYCTSRPLSGLQAMDIILTALAKKNVKLLSIRKCDGGHAATQKIAKQLGYLYKELPFKNTEPLDINFKLLKSICSDADFCVVYLDMSCIVKPINLKLLRDAVGKNTVICYDGSHVLGLIASRNFQSPLDEGADILCGSLHKTFFGPQRGVIFTNSPMLWEKINNIVNTVVSNRHYNDIAALAISASEMTEFGASYSRQVKKNAKELAKQLSILGFDVANKSINYTKTHQIWVKFNGDVKRFVDDAFKARIILNRYLLPGFKKPGLRLGLQGVTRLGMREFEMSKIASALNQIRVGNLQSAKEIVELLTTDFKEVKFSYD